MAPRGEKIDSVVDENLRVHRMSGLGIVDTSVSPFVPQNNLQILVYAAAEKASDLIRK